MTIFKDRETGTWKARIQTPEGGTKTLSTRETSKTEAKKIIKQSKLAEIELAAKAGRLTHEGLSHILAGRRVPFEEALAEYERTGLRRGLSQKHILNIKDTTLRFIRIHHLEGQPVTKGTEEMVDKSVNDDSNRKAGTRLQTLYHLRSLFDFCVQKGWILGNPANLISVRMDKLSHEQKEKGTYEPFTDEEVKRLLYITDPIKLAEAQELFRLSLEGAPYFPRTGLRDAYLLKKLGKKKYDAMMFLRGVANEYKWAPTFWHCAIGISRYTGMRLTDVARLEWDCFNKPGRIAVWTNKRDRRVDLPVTPDAFVQVVSKLPQPKSTTQPPWDKFVFPLQAEMASQMKARELSGAFTRLVKFAGIKGRKTFHSLRASYCTEAFRNGTPLDHIRSAVGHASWVTTQGYIHKD